ncbi:MAG: PQQ-binding-like beta-propeller repeat protein [Planctomycetaceae bacterium]
MSDEGSGTGVEEVQSTAPKQTGWFRPLRVWPVVVLLAGMGIARVIPSLVDDGPPNLWMSAAFGPILCGLLIMVWWLALSRATWKEKFAGIVGVVGIAAITLLAIDKSMRGPAVMVLTIPMGTAAFGIAAILFGRILSFRRTLLAILFAGMGFGFSALLKSDGMWGNFAVDLDWRWTHSPEDQILARQNQPPAANRVVFDRSDIEQWLMNPEWPGFRGADRASRQRGPVLAADWAANPPELIWKIGVGPGWSSFVVAGKLLFTQEQRGSMESVVCYAADSGREIWTQQIESRFDDPLGGPGPRATPTLADNGLFVLGASGQLMRLDPTSGDVVWQVDLREIAERKPPMWGFCSSPLVTNGMVIVHAGGGGNKGTLAFDIATGELKWSAASGDHSYSSPQLNDIEGVPCVLMLTNRGVELLDPLTGNIRLNYEWKHDGYRDLQPQLINGNSILLPTGMGSGTRCIRVGKAGEQLSAEEVWTSRDLKPDFNDFVVFEGNAYGFDNSIFACIDLESGKRQWKGGRYGKGQVLLLEDSGLLLVASEFGDVVLLKATPAAHQELGSFKAIEGKTWNHPVVIGDRLYIRNAEEAACYRLPLASSAKTE